MAEEFFDFPQEKPTGESSRQFKHFEEEWLQLGEKFSLNSAPNGRKRKLEESEDSIEVEFKRRKLNKDHKEALITLRETCSEKMKRLEQRMVTTTAPVSTASRRITTVRCDDSQRGVSENRCVKAIPFDKSSKEMPLLPVVTFDNIQTETLSEDPCSSIPLEASISRACCLEGPVEPFYSPALDFDGAVSTGEVDRLSQSGYPLMEEMTVLNELVDNMRVDLLQSSMLLTYVKDYLKKM